MRLFERVIWATLLACALGAFGLSMLWSNNLQKVFDREQMLHLMGTARLVQYMEAENASQAIDSGRLALEAYASSYIARYQEGKMHVSEREHAKVMGVLQTDFPELLAATHEDPDESRIAD